MTRPSDDSAIGVAEVRPGDVIDWLGFSCTVVATEPYVAPQRGKPRQPGVLLTLEVPGRGRSRMHYYRTETVYLVLPEPVHHYDDSCERSLHCGCGLSFHSKPDLQQHLEVSRG